MSREVYLTIQTSPPCPYLESCPARPGKHMTPGCFESETYCSGVVEEVLCIQYIVKCLHTPATVENSVGRYYWEIDSIYNNIVVKRQYYNTPYEDIATDPTTVGEMDAEVESILFVRSNEIDALPETTQEEIDVKNELLGIDFEGTSFNRKDLIPPLEE